ncbi:MAG TPA: imidazolonepropionase [Candidatus Kapabacteria bacterium]|nr:imidazolonepropionase [Candidatus Kapabacteria bacterium]
MVILHNASQVVTVDAKGAPHKAGRAMREIGVMQNASVVIDSEKISAVLPTSGLQITKADTVIDCTDKVLLPGFVDSHTHAVFAGSRANEFAMRLEGKSYQEIAAAGGGIVSTMRAVRNSSKDELKTLTEKRLKEIFQHGTTTVEVKSGYGLDTLNEVKLLEAVKEARKNLPIEVRTTFLGAHAVPPEFKGKQSEYVSLVINEMLPEIARHNLAEFCDVFCDEGYFTVEESEKIFNAAKQYSMRPKVHADELAQTGGAEMAARVEALSADHLLCVKAPGIAAMKHANVVATLLPGTAYFLGLPYAPARTMIDDGLIVAIASDFNPGSSPAFNMQMIISLACTQMKMTVEEAISASTINGAAALGLGNVIGSIEPGKQADVSIFDAPDYRDIAYYYGANLVSALVKRGAVALANAA